MNSRIDVFFPTYERIEKEVIDLSYSISFEDALLEVYSSQIADLIVRCSVEIESIFKVIYTEKTGIETDETGVCINWLGKTMALEQKMIRIVTPYFHFKTLNEFYPFKYKKKSAEDYYSSYNAIKHNKAKNINKANIYTLIRVLGSLYILNVIYKNEKMVLGNDRSGFRADKTAGSIIFEFFMAPNNKCLLECLYRVEFEEGDYSFRISYYDKSNRYKSHNFVSLKPSFQQYAKSCVGCKMNEEQFWLEVGEALQEDLKGSYYSRDLSKIIEIRGEQFPGRYIAVLNI